MSTSLSKLFTKHALIWQVTFIAAAGTAAARPISIEPQVLESQPNVSGDPLGYGVADYTAGGSTAIDSNRSTSTAESIQSLKDMSGLTWEQIAQIFGVSRRAVHQWAAGGRMNSSHIETMNSLVSLLGSLGESPDTRRSAFLVAPPGDRSLFVEWKQRTTASKLRGIPDESDALDDRIGLQTT